MPTPIMEGPPSRASTGALWFLVVAATCFLGLLGYFAADLRDRKTANDQPGYEYQQPDQALAAAGAQDDDHGSASRGEERENERLIRKAELRLQWLAWREANASVQLADAGVGVSRFSARVGLLAAVVGGLGTLLSAVAAAVAALALSQSRGATAIAVQTYVDDRRVQRAFLSCRVEGAASGDRLIVRNVGATPATLVWLRSGAVPTTAGMAVDPLSLRVGHEVVHLLGPGEEASFPETGPYAAPCEDRVFEVTFLDLFGDRRQVVARFGDGPSGNTRKSQREA